MRSHRSGKFSARTTAIAAAMCLFATMALAACGPGPAAEPVPSGPGPAATPVLSGPEAEAILAVVTKVVETRNGQIIAGVQAPDRQTLDQAFAPGAVALAEREMTQLRERQARLEELGFRYTGTGSSLRLTALKITDGKATALVNELTHLSYPPYKDGKPSPDEVYSYDQEFELLAVGPTWKVSAWHPVNSKGFPPSTVIGPEDTGTQSSPGAGPSSPAA